MPTPTIAVTCAASDQGGESVAGGIYTAKLDQTEIYDGFVVPEQVTATADADGLAILNLWPNALGVNGSSYRITARNPDTGKKFFDASVVVPNNPCNLYQIIQNAPFPNVDSAQQALIDVQALVTIANQDVAATNADAQQAAADRLQTGEDRTAARDSATNALTSEQIAVAAQLDITNNWSDKLAEAAVQAGIATTGGNVATEQVGISTMQAGLATAAKVAAEAARDAAMVTGKVYASTAAGLAATTTTQYFSVPSADSAESLILYLNSAGAAVVQKRYPSAEKITALQATVDRYENTQVKLLERSSRLVAPWPMAPAIEVSSIDAVSEGLLALPDRTASELPTKNILDMVSGDIRGEGVFTGTLTPYYALGPRGLQTATRVQLLAAAAGPAATDAFKPFNGRTLAAGNYTLRLKMKSTAGAGNQTIRYSTGGGVWLTQAITEAGFTSLSVDFASSVIAFYILGNVSVAADILIDEVQFYKTTDAIPDFADEIASGSPFKRLFNALTMSGNFVTPGYGRIRSPAFPLKKVWSEMTVMVCVKQDAITSQSHCIVAEDNAGFGSTYSLMGIGINAQGNPSCFPHPLTNAGHVVSGQGFHILGLRIKNLLSAFNLDEVTISERTDAWPGLVSSMLHAMGYNGTAFNGQVGLLGVWDKYMTDAEWAATVRSARDRMDIYGSRIVTKNWYIPEGDSITAALSAPQGPSFAFLMGAAGGVRAGENLFVHNMAVGGNPLGTLVGRLPTYIKRVAEAQAGGSRVITSVLIGANDYLSIKGTVAPYTPQDYYVALKSYWASIRATGAKLIACTVLPIGTAGVAFGGGPTGAYETGRQALNTLIRSNPALYDGLADFGGDAVMGAAGAPDTQPTLYAADGVHPLAAGHVLLANIMRPVVVSLMS